MLTDTSAKPRHALLRVLLAGCVLTLLSGCGALYVAQAAKGQWQVLQQRRPIDEVVADAATPDALRMTLLEVDAAREFAARDLALPDNSSYRSYADIGRRYVVWNVVAAPEFSLEPEHWCFPVAGCVAYRGYFSEARARAFASTMRRRGFDVVIGGVPAYSTLGRFADPVLNTMLGYGNDELVAIIFHELSHQLIYVPGDSEFNEAFAVTVEQVGLERWLAARGRFAQLEHHRARRARQLEFLAVLTARRSELARLYASDLPTQILRERKRAIMAGLEADIRGLEEVHGEASPYRAWLTDGLNNAHLASVATYFQCVPGFERLLVEAGGSLSRFYAAVRELAALPQAERRLRVCGQLSGGESG